MNSPSISYKERPDHSEMRAMPFVNEYATEEDLAKFDLNEIWDQYHPFSKGKYYLGERANFTIDRDRNVFLMVLSIGGRETPSGTSFLLWVDGEKIRVFLEAAPGGSLSFSEKPYRRIWGLERIEIGKNCKISKSKALDLVKEALAVYGSRGVTRQIPDTVVSFNF